MIDAPSPLPLPEPADYFPIRNGRWDVSPALRPLGADFGNGHADARLFQFDRRFPEFRANKLACRAERFGKYVCADGFDEPVREAVARLFVARLTAEWPALFVPEQNGARLALHCAPTGERLAFDSRMRLARVDGAGAAAPPYADAFDALCCQFPEDIAVVRRRSAERGDWIAALHLCAPSAWAGEEKIGRSWADAHAPVPGMERLRAAAAPGLVAAMIEGAPAVRFTWSVQFADRLNDHPEPPPGIAKAAWKPAAPDPLAAEPFYLRVERQTLWGLPAADAAVFAIRIYHTPRSVLRADAARCDALRRALLSMSPEALAYKSLAEGRDAVLGLLEAS